jgi:hypothetical protein
MEPLALQLPIMNQGDSVKRLFAKFDTGTHQLFELIRTQREEQRRAFLAAIAEISSTKV